MKNVTIVKFLNAVKVNGFNIQEGFYGLYVAGKLAAVSSGWCCGYAGNGVDYDTTAYIYTPRRGGRWVGRWVDYRNYGTLATFADYIRSESNEEHEREERLDELEEIEFYWKGGESYEAVHGEE